jgi:nucleoside-diphosphate-sugar epimerase
MKVLITGTNSFVGTNFKMFSKYRDCDEISLLDNMPDNIEFKKYDVVLHLAAIVHQSKKIADEEYFKVNRDLSIKVAEHSKLSGVRQFIFMSTLKVFGDTQHGHCIRDESSECFPTDAYGLSKLQAEKKLKELEDENFIVTMIRPALVYGKGVKANMLSLIKLVERCPFLPFGNIHNRRNFVYSENLIGYIDKAIELKSSGILIAIDPEPVSTTMLVNYIARALSKSVFLFSLPGIVVKIIKLFIPGTVSRLFESLEFDNSRTIMMLKFKIPYTTEEGIRRTVLDYMGL